ncbi:MAG: hypothetical protein IVW55_16690 [Chloroflexi bacterium]|nr:hypothetical protein [Chloroflexota bacterium]
MAQVEIDNIVEYQTFRKNPGPLLTKVSGGQPLLVLKGRLRLIIVDAAAYNDLVTQASGGANLPESAGTTTATPLIDGAFGLSIEVERTA